MAGDYAKLHAEIDSRFDALIVGSYFHCVKANIVSFGAAGNRAARIIGDVKLARQSVKVAVLEDLMMNRTSAGHHIDEFVGVKSSGCSGSDVPDVVGARALGG